MIRSLALLLIFLCYSPIASASILGDLNNAWQTVKDCVDDPCNCGDPNKMRTEYWDGESRRFARNRNCPPYNKEAGRRNNTCLVRTLDPKKPGTPNITAPGFPNKRGYYKNICAEYTEETTYFDPKIRVRGQQCNLAACWHTETTLNWDGECVQWPSAYPPEMHRMCARIAVPKDEGRDFPQDPGYTQGQHLNDQGAQVSDAGIVTNEGETIFFDMPKLCLYYDPSSSLYTFDPVDIKPKKQPFHKTEDVHPVIQVIIFANTANNITTTPTDLLAALFGTMDNGEEGENTFGSVMQDAFNFLSNIISVAGDAFIWILEEMGEMNKVVNSKYYGCVELPLGPFPPPYCESVSPLVQRAVTHNICHKNSTGALVQSTTDNPCVVSTLPNNFIHNSIRVGHETLLPLCRNGENPMTTDICVAIDNAAPTASSLHGTGGHLDILKHCSNVPSGTPCVRTMLPHTCSVTANGCQAGWRVIYAERVADQVTVKSYFNHDLEDCPSNTSSTCQEIWGVNIGEFVDVGLIFPAIQNPADISALPPINVRLTDRSGNVSSFSSSIVRIPTPNTIDAFTQEPNQICVFKNQDPEEDAYVVGCNKRAPHSGVKIHDCSSPPNNSINCRNHSYFTPGFIISYNEGGYSTSALITPLSVHDSDTNPVINLAGVEFESFVTDDDFITRPFSGSKSPNASSIFGVYKDNIMPVNGNAINDNAIYLSGLEYINGYYHLGGKNACLTTINDIQCPDDTTKCVLTNLLNRNTVKCSEFIAKVSKYSQLNVCSPTEITTCPVIDNMSKISGGVLNIRDCGLDGKCYDGGVALCQTSYAAVDRHIPAPTADISTEYYNVITNPGFDADQHTIRNKTAEEMRLCVKVPQGVCAEENDYSEDNGYAFWPETPLGEVATGTCRPGWSAAEPLKRHCVPIVTNTNKGFGFERLYRNIPQYLRMPPFYKAIEYNNVKCIEDTPSPFP